MLQHVSEVLFNLSDFSSVCISRLRLLATCLPRLIRLDLTTHKIYGEW